jgi:hypothetical protein
MSTAVGSSPVACTPLMRALLGFLAGAIAVVIAHQVMVLLLYLIGQIPNPPYSFRGNQIGVPLLINQMFWGGLWGVLYGFIVGSFPAAWPTWMNGLVFGLGVHSIIGNWVVVPLIRNLFVAVPQPLFSGWVPLRMLIGVLIGTAFGMGVAYVFAALTRYFPR